MLGAITSLLTKPRTLHADLKLHHIEQSGGQLVLGFEVAWRNDFLHPLEIDEVYVDLFDKGPNAAPVTFTYSERFACIPYQKTITKIGGSNAFSVAPGANRVEHLRFLTREMTDLREGKYDVELHSSVAEGIYVHCFHVKVVPELKIYAAGSDGADAGTAGRETALLARMRKIAPN
jgi:hypothetical protein